jgi:formate hydrogenlyase subunit 3/multisubunit Na+/H+ antiporter MnhD subunit
MLLTLALVCVATLLVLAPAGIGLSRSRLGGEILYGASLVIAAVAASGAVYFLLFGGGLRQTQVLPLGLPWLGAHFRLDGLAALFVIIINFGAAAASLFAIGYGRHEDAPGRVLPFYPAFLAAMNLVVLANDAFTFLVSWEFMSLVSWALVMAHHEEEENSQAGFVYLVMASFGTLCLLLAFALLAGADGGYDFSTIEARRHSIELSGLVVILALVGAGSKAGLVPLHVWLPLAHPAAPSHVSALMSGVMTKVAVYGFVRIVFDLIGGAAWWWAMIVLAMGAASAVIGVLYAVVEKDLKRLLAYSTIENVGIVFVGLGLALAFRANQQNAAAALALTASLLHAFNHSLFKSLLFFGAGAVLNATGLRDLERLGGLIHRMPATALAFLGGSLAISALPPFNGFVSEWLTFQAVLLSPSITQWGLKLMIPAVGALLALSAALAAACFVRAFGLAFLGRPRDPATVDAHEVDRFSTAAMLLLAGLCLLAGVFPGFLIDALNPVVSLLFDASMPRQAELPWLTIIPIAESRSSYNGLLVFLFIACSAWLVAFAIHRLASRRTRRSDVWDCGTPDLAPINQYSASSFAQPIRRVFANAGISTKETVEMPAPGSLSPATFTLDVRDAIWDWAYAPLAFAIDFAAGLLNHLQFLTIRRYLSLVFASLVFLLLVLAAWA